MAVSASPEREHPTDRSSEDALEAVRDPGRLDALRDSGLLDSEVEEEFDRLTRLAAKLLGASATFFSLVDEDRDFYKSCFGFPEPLATQREVRGVTFCHFSLVSDGALVIPDTRADPVYREVPTVESMGVAAYLGVPVHAPGGEVLGSFCAIDFHPRDWTPLEVETVKELAKSAEREIARRHGARRQAQLVERERASRQRITGILESITDAFIALDRDWRFVYVNHGGREAIRRILQRDPDSVFGQSFWDVVPQFRGTRFEEEYRRVMQSRQPAHFEEYATEFGVWFEVHAYPAVEGLSIYFRDVSERKRVEAERDQALADAERRAREEAALRRATEAVTATFTVEEVIRQIAESAIVATDADGAFVERIDADLSEVNVVAVAGAPTPSLGSSLPFAGSYTERVMRSGVPELVPRLGAADSPLPGELYTPCGECSALVIPLLDAGEAIGALFLLRDAEKRGFQSDEVARAHTFANLASLAFRKVHLLQESEGKREELERVMESRARLIRGFSHDVKNPLGAADGFLALLEDGIFGDLAGKQRESIGRVRRSIGTALGLINDLVEIARAEAGQLEIRPTAVDVREVAREMTEEYRAQAAAKGLSIHSERPPEFPMIESDPTRVRQILGNLVSNAVKYTREGGVSVEVSVRSGKHAPGQGQWVAIAVSDSGPGIPEEKRHLLFREFTRLDPDAGQGAGLGLAISHRIAQALGGNISVESEVGRGSTFTLWLPMVGGPSGAAAALPV